MSLKFISSYDVSEMVGLSTTEITELELADDFPLSFQLHGKAMYVLREVQEWMDLHIQERDFREYAKRSRTGPTDMDNSSLSQPNEGGEG